MRPQRFFLLSMVAAESAALYVVYRNPFFPILAVILAALGLTGGWRLTLSSAQKAIASLAILVIYFILWRLFPYSRADILGSLGYRVTYVFAQYFISLQLLELWLDTERHAATAALYGMLALTCAGNIFSSPSEQALYALCSVLFVASLVLYLRSCTMELPSPARPARGRYVWIAAALGAVVLGGLSVRSVLYAHREFLSALFTNAPTIPGSVYTAGFSRDVKLGDVTRLKLSSAENSTALRVFSKDAPGYLRGMAFTYYNPATAEWQKSLAERPLAPSDPSLFPNLPAARTGCSRFAFPSHDPRPCHAIDVWPAPLLTEGMFSPLGTTVLEAPVTGLRVDENQIADSDELIGGVNYTSYVPQPAPRAHLSLAMRKRLVQPPAIDPRVHQLADRIFEGCTTPRQKIDAVVGYFLGNYRYNIGIRIPPGQDPLTYFLLEHPAAHCEYFAAGAAVLLRMGGVPARYITGFVVEERNSVGRYWVARNKDAHAWVEAWDDAAGWVIVDATPGAGVPSPTVGSSIGYILDYIRFRLQELTAMTRVNGLSGLLAWLGNRAGGLWTLIASPGPAATAVKLALAAALALLLWRRWRRRRPARIDARIQRLHALLAAADARLARLGLVRARNETLHQFAARILQHDPPGEPASAARAPLAAWYLRYAAVRYGGSAHDEDIILLERDSR